MRIKTIAVMAAMMLASMTTCAQTKPLPDETWSESKWICVADAPEVQGRVNEHTRAADGANWFMTTITNEKEVKKALWMTVSLGVNELYVNHQRIGDEVLRPGFSHHSRTKYSFTYDVTKQFQTKKGNVNTLTAQVTPGWWADKIITPSGSNGMYGQKCAFRGVLELTFADGTKRLYGTNTKDWKAGIAGPVKHAAIFDGEEYDARAHNSKFIIHNSQLAAPAISTEYKGVIVPNCGAEVYQIKEWALNPKRAYVYSKAEDASDEAYGKIIIDREYAAGKPMTIKPGEHLVIDFGQNCAAVPSFYFKAEEGTRLTCLPGELLNDGNGAKSRGMDGPEGSVHRRNLRIHDKSIRLDYTFADSKDAVGYTPRQTFFGYRYLDITATDEVTIESIQSIPVSSITPEIETGHITTGNDLVNQLISNTVWGMRSNYLSVPTDCPQRNERLGWTADTQVFCETGTYFANTDRFFHKWLHDLRDSQNDEGGYPSVAPPGQYGSSHNEYMRFGWTDAGIIVPWTVWKQFGDKSIIEEIWESMERYMTHTNLTKYDHTALVKENGNYQWGDWLSYEPLETCGRGAFDGNDPKPEAIEYWNYLGASYWAMDAAMMVDMAKATGRNAAEYEAMVKEAKDYLRGRFFNTDGSFKCDILNTMQTPALFALKNNLFEGEAKAKMIERLRQNFQEHDDCLQTGFLGTSILMPTLTDNGLTDVAYTLLFQRKNPSWLYSVDNGATTIWERWNSYTKESGMGPKGMNSFNHYAYGCVCQWIWQTCAGIASDPAQPGFKHIIMKPVPDRRLGHLDATFNSAAGIIESHWKYEGNDWVWTFTIPAGATASVTLPYENESKEYQSGTYTIRKTLYCGPVPSENQLRWQEMEMYAFIHYSMNTYTDQEWGFGNEDPKLFNPSDLDCRQWARVCKQAGMKGIIFTAKHHCGFCMWPSKYTEYSVKNAPWKNGKGDVVRELAEACREEGLKFAVYLSPWDRNHKDYGKPEYITYFRNQLRELLTQYGDIFEVWFDGANGGDGWYGGANETRRIDGKTYYQWAETFRMIRELQPHAVIWNDGGDRGDLRWVGTEAGNVGETNWSLMPSKGDTPYPMLHYGVEDGDVWCPGETNTSIRPGWFYHETENEHVKSLSKLMDTYYKSVGRNSTLLLNFPIAPNGRIHPNDSLRGIAFKKMIDEVFKENLAEKARFVKEGMVTTIDFGKPVAFNRFVAEEDIALGQRVKKFSLEVFANGQWQPLKDALVDNGDGLTTIGHRRIICFPTVKATQLRFTITDCKAVPVIKKLGVYLAPDLTADIPDSGEKKSSALHIFFSSPTQMMIDWDQEQTFTTFRYLPPQDSKDGLITHYTLWASTDWSHWTKLASGEFSNIVNNPIWQTIKFPATKARIIKLDADRLAEGSRMGYGDIELK